MVSTLYVANIELLEKNHRVLFQILTSIYILMICKARNWNSFILFYLFISLLFFSYRNYVDMRKMKQLRFPSLNKFRLTFGHLCFCLLPSAWLLDRLDILLHIVSSSSSTILLYLSFFQSFLIRSKKIIANHRDPNSF